MLIIAQLFSEHASFNLRAEFVLDLAVKLGCQTWLPNLAVKPGCQTWLPNLAAKLGCQTWLPNLAAKPGCQTWLPNLAVKLGCQICKNKLAIIPNNNNNNPLPYLELLQAPCLGVSCLAPLYIIAGEGSTLPLIRIGWLSISNPYAW